MWIEEKTGLNICLDTQHLRHGCNDLVKGIVVYTVFR